MARPSPIPALTLPGANDRRSQVFFHKHNAPGLRQGRRFWESDFGYRQQLLHPVLQLVLQPVLHVVWQQVLQPVLHALLRRHTSSLLHSEAGGKRGSEKNSSHTFSANSSQGGMGQKP